MKVMKCRTSWARLAFAVWAIGGFYTSAGSARDADAQPAQKLVAAMKTKDGATLPGQGTGLQRFAFSPDSALLASRGPSGRVTIYDLATGKQTEFETPASVEPILFSPDGKLLAAADRHGAIVLRDLATRKSALLERHSSPVCCLAFSTDGKQLVSSGRNDKTVKVWNVETKKEVASFDNANPVRKIVFSPNGKFMATGTDDGVYGNIAARIYDVSTWREKAAIKLDGTNVRCLVFSPDSRTLAAGSDRLILWDLVAGKEKSSRYVLGSCNLGFYSSEGKLLAIMTPSSWSVAKPREAGVITLQDAEKAEDLAKFEGHSDHIAAVSLSANRTLLASASEHLPFGARTPPRGEVKVWDLKLKKEVFSSTAGLEVVQLSPDGTFLAAAGRDGTVKVWRLPEVIGAERKP